MPESLEIVALRTGQLSQVQDQFRVEFYNLQLRFELLIKMMEEKGTMIPGEFEKRWPLYLKNHVGVLGPDGMMDGSLRVTMYGM
jgi:hypothetical protein